MDDDAFPLNHEDPPRWEAPVPLPSAAPGPSTNWLPPGAWPAPHADQIAGHRVTPAVTPTPEQPPRPSRARRAWVGLAMAAAVVVGAVAGYVGVSALSSDRSASVSVPATITPPPTTIPPAPAVTPGPTIAPTPSTLAPTPSVPVRPTTPSADATPGGSGSIAPAAADMSSYELGLVDINTELGFQESRAAGTGMILTPSGEVLTNTHVISGATKITVVVVRTGKTYTAEVVGSDATNDVALLQIKGAPALDTVQLADSSLIEVGDPVTAVGNAGGDGGAPTIAPGSVTALDQAITVSDGQGGDLRDLSGLIEIDARLQPGESGGPLYDRDGKVIGMNTAGSAERSFRNTRTQGYAIAINTAKAIVGKIRAGEPSDTIQFGVRGFIGVQVQGDSATNGSPATEGAVVAAVIAGTPAAKAGLQAGDIITSVDGAPVTGDRSLADHLHGRSPGDTIELTVIDGTGASRTVTIILTTGPAA